MIVPTKWNRLPLRTQSARRLFVLGYFVVMAALIVLCGCSGIWHWLGLWGVISMYSELYKVRFESADTHPADGKFSWDRSTLQKLKRSGRLKAIATIFGFDEREEKLQQVAYQGAYYILGLLFVALAVSVVLDPQMAVWVHGRIWPPPDTSTFMAVVRLIPWCLMPQWLVATLPQAVRLWIQPDDVGEGEPFLVRSEREA